MTGGGGNSPGTQPAHLVWRDDRFYAPLRLADENAFAWEWLRRTLAYKTAWNSLGDDWSRSRAARRFGLERFEDPALPSPAARPIWTDAIDPKVIRAQVLDPLAAAEDRIDLRLLSHLVTLSVDDDDVEHILFSDGYHGLRLDVVDGTLIGCPSALTFALQGLAKLRGPLSTLHRLTQLVARGSFASTERSIRRDRWILELRVADAISQGATYQEIARALFASAIPDRRWRIAGSSYRQRVQRLARSAHQRLREPLDRRWFI